MCLGCSECVSTDVPESGLDEVEGGRKGRRLRVGKRGVAKVKGKEIGARGQRAKL